MSIWVLRTETPPGAEGEETNVTLPVRTLEDFTKVFSGSEVRLRLKEQYPDRPPESLTREAERVWRTISRFEEEDLLAIPLQEKQQVAFAEVMGKPLYRAGAEGEEGTYHLPVRWFGKRVSFRRFGKNRPLLESGESFKEVNDKKLRYTIRAWLPLKGNRFAKWRWLAVIFIIVMLTKHIARIAHGGMGIPSI